MDGKYRRRKMSKAKKTEDYKSTTKRNKRTTRAGFFILSVMCLNKKTMANNSFFSTSFYWLRDIIDWLIDFLSIKKERLIDWLLVWLDYQRHLVCLYLFRFDWKWKKHDGLLFWLSPTVLHRPTRPNRTLFCLLLLLFEILYSPLMELAM